jgi:nucleoside 2-deoxyribosyltransferase
MAKEKVYLSGPITSDPDGYKEHFANAAKALEKLGFDVTNPSKDEYDEDVKEKGHSDKWTKEAWLEYIHEDINMVTSHDYICLLKGWEISSGALLEVGTAKRFGLKLIMEDPNAPDGFSFYDKWSVTPSLVMYGPIEDEE